MTAIGSESYRRHDVPADSIQKWQKTVDLMAANFDVPAGLIIRVLPSQIEVLVASNSSENPYKLMASVRPTDRGTKNIVVPGRIGRG